MINIPVKFPRDPYCRAISRMMLTVDAATGELYLGVTPDGVSFGRDMLTKISVWSEDKNIAYTCKASENKVFISSEKGEAVLAIAMPNKLVIEGTGISLMLGNGKAAGLFMGGGSAVDDAAEGALYVTAGVRLRTIARRGYTEVRSAWDLDALSDPDPQVFLHPDADGKLEAVVFETDFDEQTVDDSITLDAAAADLAAEFEAFLDALAVKPESEEAMHAAYIIWTALQPARVLNQQCITTPEYVANRRTEGTAMFYDNVLLAAFIKDPADAVERLCSFLKYIRPDGMIPRSANNRMFMPESEVPLFGVVFAARPELVNAVSEEQYETMKKALAWWQNERFCSERKLFYYLHRYEPGCGKKLLFADVSPEFTPELNTYMVLWLDALASIAKRFGRNSDAEAFANLAEEIVNSINERLWNGKEYICINIEDRPVCAGHPCVNMTVLLADRVHQTSICAELPDVYALPLVLTAPDAVKPCVKNAASKRINGTGINDLKQAMIILACET